MRKLCFVLTALLMTVPAFAGINISCSQVGTDLVAEVSYSMDGGDANLPRAFGLDISVDSGATIDDLTDTDPCFWVYPGTIVISGGDVNDYGTPVAPNDAPGAQGDLGTGAITIEMGSLYAAEDPNHTDPPASSGVLFRIEVSAECNVTIAGNSARGNVVLESTDEADVNYSGCLIASSECYTGPDYTEWVTVGKPDSWCYPKQCHGDATGGPEQYGRNNWVAVGLADFQVLAGGYNDNSYVDPATDPWIAADFTHNAEQYGRNNWVRVGLADFQILAGYYNDPCTTVPGDCNP